MLKQRLITAIILVPLVLALLFYANAWILAAVAVAIFLACSWEWTKLMPLENINFKLLFMLVSLMALWLCGLFYTYWLYVGLFFWLLILAAVLTYPKSTKIWGKKAIVGFAGCLLLPLFIQSLIHLFILRNGKSLLLCLLFLVWAADIGAYFTGKLWGKHKMIPQVSPGKSWEGVLGGIALAMLVALATYYWVKPGNVLLWLVLALTVVFISILGDLFISILKRRCQLKDTGAILPGHGGALDRLDSLIAALPLYLFGLTLLLGN